MAYRYSLLVAVAAVLGLCPVYGQNGIKKPGYAQEKWKLKDPFEQKVFIENNEGQFDGKVEKANTKVLYSTRIGGVDVYLTSDGIIYRYDKYPEIKPERGKQEDEEDKKVAPETHFFKEEWKGASKDVTVIAEDEVSFYYCYASSCKHTTIAHAFKKLLYKNMYPGIDIEYAFDEERKGIEYTLIVHPGADLALVKLNYPDAESIHENSRGDIEMESSFGLFTDNAPAKAYYQNDNKPVTSNFVLNGKEVSFATEYDHSKILVIDPFKTNPLFTGYNAGYDVCYDLSGNVYAYGSFLPFQEVKINNAGVLQWTFNAIFPISTGQYGDFAVDERTGSSYLTCSGYDMIIKVNNAGKQVDSLDKNSTINEIWRMAYNACEGKIVLAGGGTAGDYQLASLDTSLTTFSPVNTLGTTGGHHDASLLCIDNTNNYTFMATDQSNGSPSIWDNGLVKVPINTFLPIIWSDLPDGYNFIEGGANINYINGVTGHTYAMNGMVASPNWLYLFDGSVLTRVNKNTGAIGTKVTVSPVQYHWGGIDVDWCDNLYVSDSATINIYDSALTLTGSIPAGYAVYDLHIMPGNQLCATGKGFVSAYTITTNAMTIKKTSTSAGCATANGTASATLTGCGNASSQYSYLWSNGATTSSISGLSAGTYTVTISPFCDFPFTDTVDVQGGSNGGMTLTMTRKNITCFGGNNGSATVGVSGGTGPYTYSWSPGGGTGTTISNLTAGTYSVTVTDLTGCNTATIAISQPLSLVASIVSTTNVGCKGGNTGASTVAVSGGTGAYTYSWSPAGGTTATASNLSAGIYTVNISDSNGCSALLMDTIHKDSVPIALIAGNNFLCAGDTLTLTASGGTSYTWNNGATTSSIKVTPTVNTSYSVVVSNGPCTADTNFTVAILPQPKITLTSTNKSLCKGDSSVLTVSGGSSYLWSTGSTSTSITVAPATTTTYSVQAGNGTCTKDTSVTITVNTKPIAAVSGDMSICYGNNTILSASGGETYKWIPATGLNCDTCSSVQANPAVTTTYTVIAYNGSCTDTTIAKVTVSPRPKGSACCSDTIQMGDTVKITATDSSGASYLWLPGTSLSCDTCSSSKAYPQFSTTYTVTMTERDGCQVVDSVRIFVEGCSTVWIPNAFTPNGDHLNEVFEPKGVCMVSYTMYIFNRWGELLYYTNESKPWDGKFKGNVVQEDTYVYKIIEMDGFRKLHTIIGRVTVIR